MESAILASDSENLNLKKPYFPSLPITDWLASEGLSGLAKILRLSILPDLLSGIAIAFLNEPQYFVIVFLRFLNGY
jgi:hypothetical protein